MSENEKLVERLLHRGAIYRKMNATTTLTLDDEAAAALTSAEARIKMLEAPVKVGELGRDDLRRRARAMLERNGWKPGDQFSAHSTIELMIALATDAVQSPLDQCAYPECGCCHDATCTEALTHGARDAG